MHVFISVIYVQSTNDLITYRVIPGSGIYNESATLTTMSNIDNYKHFSKAKTCNDSTHNKVVQTPDVKIDKLRANSCNSTNNTMNDSDITC